MLIIKRIDKDIIINNSLLNSIKLIIKIIFKEVIFGEKFINKMFKLLNIEKIIINNHIFKVMFNVNIILLVGDKIFGKMLIIFKLINKKIIVWKIIFDDFIKFKKYL